MAPLGEEHDARTTPCVATRTLFEGGPTPGPRDAGIGLRVLRATLRGALIRRARGPHSFWSLEPSRARPRASETLSTAGLMGRRGSLHPRCPADASGPPNACKHAQRSQSGPGGPMFAMLGTRGPLGRGHRQISPRTLTRWAVLEKEAALESRHGTLCRWPWWGQGHRNSRVP